MGAKEELPQECRSLLRRRPVETLCLRTAIKALFRPRSFQAAVCRDLRLVPWLFHARLCWAGVPTVHWLTTLPPSLFLSYDYGLLEGLLRKWLAKMLFSFSATLLSASPEITLRLEDALPAGGGSNRLITISPPRNMPNRRKTRPSLSSHALPSRKERGGVCMILPASSSNPASHPSKRPETRRLAGLAAELPETPFYLLVPAAALSQDFGLMALPPNCLALPMTQKNWVYRACSVYCEFRGDDFTGELAAEAAAKGLSVLILDTSPCWTATSMVDTQATVLSSATTTQEAAKTLRNLLPQHTPPPPSPPPLSPPADGNETPPTPSATACPLSDNNKKPLAASGRCPPPSRGRRGDLARADPALAAKLAQAMDIAK